MTKQERKVLLSITGKYFIAVSAILFSTIVISKPFIEARAQIVVTDPGSTAQNLLTAIRTLQSNINEAQQLAYQLQNLQKLNYTSTSAYSSTYSNFLSKLQTLKGSLNNTSSATNNFQQAYPTSGFNSSNLLNDLQSWQTQLGNSMTDSVGTNAAVLGSIPDTQANMNNLVSASNNSQGSLEATQAGNQMLGSISGQLSQMNSQMATYQTAEMNNIAKQESQRAALDAEAVRFHTQPSFGTTKPKYIIGH